MTATWKADDDTALILVDIQKGFTKGGSLEVADGDAVVPVANDLKWNFNTVVLTQDFHPPGHSSFASSHPGKKPFDEIDMPYGKQTLWPDHCEQGTASADFHDDLEIGSDDLIIQKGKDPAVDSYSAFFENDRITPVKFNDGQTLTEKLHGRGIKKIVVMGLAGDYCVGYTALDGLKQGFDVAVVEDGIRSISEAGQLAMNDDLRQAGGMIVLSDQLPQVLGL